MVDQVDAGNVNQVVDPGKGAGSGRGAGSEKGAGPDKGAPPAESTAEPATDATPGFELPLLLFAGFRTLIDRLHAELARQGHPDLRPAHGFALQAIAAGGPRGATASDIGRRLGVSKQAAGKTVDRLLAVGYAERADDPTDARRKLVHLTPHGLDALARSAAIFDDLRAEWTKTLGAARVRDMETALRQVVPPETTYRLDAPSWLGGA